MLKIGSLKLSSNLILAPMSGISDLSFRLLNHRFGCELAFVEMINARSLGYKSKKTRSMLATEADDKPLGVQLLGNEPKFILRAMDILRCYAFDVLDFNAACPEKKVTSRGEGAALLKEPKKLQKLLKILVKNSPVPVTVKIRSGWDKDSIPAREVALYAQDSGISALFIHGRTKYQEYSGGVDYQAIRQVKEALSIPVIASGDIFSGPLAQKMYAETGCDGLLLARGALGNPWIFREITRFLDDQTIAKRPTADEIVQTMTEHINLAISVHAEKTGVILFRKFFGWYVKGLRKIRALKEKACLAKTREEMLAVIEEFQVSHCPKEHLVVK